MANIAAVCGWRKCKDSLPPIGEVVLTKIDDGRGCRNEGRLKRGGSNGNLWFLQDGSMYVYYVPTHWQPLTPAAEDESCT